MTSPRFKCEKCEMEYEYYWYAIKRDKDFRFMNCPKDGYVCKEIKAKISKVGKDSKVGEARVSKG